MTLFPTNTPQGLRPGGQPSWVATVLLIFVTVHGVLVALGYVPAGL